MSKLNRAIQNATLGPLAAEVKRRVKPQQWRSIVARAHKQGFTVDSFLDTSVARPLKERTHQSIVKQARSTVATAYKPAEQQLTQREARVNALDSKRARDEDYYKDWLTAKHAELATHAAAADQTMMDAGRQIQEQTAENYARANVNAQQSVAAAGSVSNPADSNALNVELPGAAKHDIDSIAAQRQLTQDIVGSHQKTEQVVDASNIAYQASISAKRQAQTWQALGAIGEDRGKLGLQRGADTAKELSGLLADEVSKAQARGDNELVKQRLSIQDATLQQRAKEAAQQLGLDYKSLAAKTSHNQVMESIGKTANQLAQGRLDVAWYKAKHPNTASKKGKHPQRDFDYGFALLASSTTVDKHGNEHPLSFAEVRNHRAKYIGALIAKGKISRSMAARVYEAYLARDGLNEDPGKWTDYGKHLNHVGI